MNWEDLTKTEAEHLAGHKIKSTEKFHQVAEFQKGLRENRPQFGEPCHECKSICERFGINV